VDFFQEISGNSPHSRIVTGQDPVKIRAVGIPRHPGGVEIREEFESRRSFASRQTRWLSMAMAAVMNVVRAEEFR
jgi:hypothetical protein